MFDWHLSKRERLGFCLKPLLNWCVISVHSLFGVLHFPALGNRSMVYAWLVDPLIWSRCDWAFVPQYCSVSRPEVWSATATWLRGSSLVINFILLGKKHKETSWKYLLESKPFTESPAQESLLFCKITAQTNIHNRYSWTCRSQKTMKTNLIIYYNLIDFWQQVYNNCIDFWTKLFGVVYEGTQSNRCMVRSSDWVRQHSKIVLLVIKLS